MSRARLRLTLALAGLLPALLALAFAVKVMTMLSHDGDGRGQFDDGDYAAAAEEFAANETLNWFEPWIAAFDEGAARHADGDLVAALARYGQALEDVPAEHECTVRINAALALESLGDAAAAAGDADEAAGHWQAGLDALAEGECPTDAPGGEAQTDDAAAVDQRLREKQQQQQEQQEEQEEQDQPQTPEERREQEQRERKEQRLEDRNEEAIEEEQEHEDSQRDRDYSEYQW